MSTGSAAKSEHAIAVIVRRALFTRNLRQDFVELATEGDAGVPTPSPDKPCKVL